MSGVPADGTEGSGGKAKAAPFPSVDGRAFSAQPIAERVPAGPQVWPRRL